MKPGLGRIMSRICETYSLIAQPGLSPVYSRPEGENHTCLVTEVEAFRCINENKLLFVLITDF